MKKIIAFLIIACFSIPQFAFAGAWTLPKNTVGLEQYMKVHWAKEDFGPDGDRRRFSRDARSWGWGMASKVEYGLLENLTLMGSMEYKEDKYKEYARPTNWGTYSVQNHGITNVDFGARLRLLEDPVVLSGQIKTSIYIPYDDLPLSDVAEAPELHDRNNSVELRGLIGKYFDTAMPFYVGAEYGYRFKDHDVCNDIPFFIDNEPRTETALLVVPRRAVFHVRPPELLERVGFAAVRVAKKMAEYPAPPLDGGHRPDIDNTRFCSFGQLTEVRRNHDGGRVLRGSCCHRGGGHKQADGGKENCIG